MRFYLLFLLIVCQTHGEINQQAKIKNLIPYFHQQDDKAIEDIVDVKERTNFSVILRKDGTAWGQGKNDYGQLGVGKTSEFYAAPIETSTGPLKDIESISCTDTTTIAVRKNGSIWRSDNENVLIQNQLDPKTTYLKTEINKFDKTTIPLHYKTKVDQVILASGTSNTLNSTLLSYSDAEEPQQAPEEPFSISIVATGPYRAPAQIELVASVTHPDSTIISKVDFYNGENLLGSVTTPPYELAYQDVPVGSYRIEARAHDLQDNITTATTEFEVIPSNRYDRGFGTNTSYLTSIIAIDNERGCYLDGISDFSTLFPRTKYSSYPWFLKIASSLQDLNEPCWHINNSNNTICYSQVNNLPKVENTIVGGQPPFVAFGSQGGGSALYTKQDYHFGIAAGGKNFNITNNPDILIEVYDKNTIINEAIQVKPICTQTYSLPLIFDPAELKELQSNNMVVDYHLIDTNHDTPIDFDTKVQYASGGEWGQFVSYPLLITHRSENDAYYYKVSFMGITEQTINTSTNIYDMSKNSLGATNNSSQGINNTYNLTYALDFENPDSWSSTILTLPHFQGTFLPSCYAGKSVDELIHQTPPVKDSLSPPNVEQLTQLNNSPEIKRHSKLDQLAIDLGNDPIAIANYVQNKIQLTDSIGYNVSGSVDPNSINPQGVSRDALATYLEGQGSPIEQCALLIYLLRKAGYSAGYVFPEHNGTLMFDEQLSKMLHIQLRGAMTLTGPSSLPELIPVNYPWVALYLDKEKKWVHLFPWIKDTEVTEGENVWDYFPDNYKNERQWLIGYLLNDQSIRNPLSTTNVAILKENNVGTLFPLYASTQLANTNINLSLGDVGITYRDQQQYYEDWNDFPRPWKTPLISDDNITSNLDATSSLQNPKLVDKLKNIFDTVSIQVISDRNHQGISDTNNPILLDTGAIPLVNLHDRRLVLYHQIASNNPITCNLILSLEQYDDSDSNLSSHTFLKGDTPDNSLLQGNQKIIKQLDDNDDVLLCKVTYQWHRQVFNDGDTAGTSLTANLNSNAQFPGLYETTIFPDQKTDPNRAYTLRKGDMCALDINYGKVTKEMLNFEAEKYWNYQKTVAANPVAKIDPELAIGQLLYLMGKMYYYDLSSAEENLENITKNRVISWRGSGAFELSAIRNQDGSLQLNENNDIKFGCPSTDVFYDEAVTVGNKSLHLESGKNFLGDNALFLSTGEGSAQEHRVINEFFNQTNAVSTVKLLDLAQGWNEATGVARSPSGNGVAVLNAANAADLLSKPYMGARPNPTASFPENTLSDWILLAGGFPKPISDAICDPFATVIMTAGPKKASTQDNDYIGMGAMILRDHGCAAIIAQMNDQLYWKIQHGGHGSPLSYNINPSSLPSDFVIGSRLIINADNGYTFNGIASTPQNPDFISSNYDWNLIDTGAGLLTPDQVDMLNKWNQTSNYQQGKNFLDTGSDTAAAWKQRLNTGDIGKSSFYGTLKTYVMDPVSVSTGEFYINALDLKLHGPMPLEIRRIYSSQDQSENNFGHGWRLGYFPYLMFSTDFNEDSDIPPTLIYASETDGSVIAYRYNTTQQNWTPQPSDNPNLINENDGTSLSSRNLFNNCIKQGLSKGTYTLTSSDGSVRTFKMRSFPPLGTSDITRRRPYLQTWQDNQSNYYSFTFGENNKSPDYGQLIAINSSNGNSLHFHYDNFEHITQAFSNDGQSFKYEYDNYGDLTKVTLSDQSVINYSYDHQSVLNNGSSKPYSTHLLTQEAKPDGRILQNAYDAQGRVTNQLSTTGISPVPTPSGSFNYSVTSTNTDSTINGTTTLTDANGNSTTYTITHNQISNIAYPENRAIKQNWNFTDKTRSLTSTTDTRGLTTTYQYDAQGNVTSRSLTGNITGNNSSETAKSTLTYNFLNCLTSVTDPVNNVTSYNYGNSSLSYNPTSIVTTAASGQTINSVQIDYTKSGGACGLISNFNNNGSITTYTYDQHGFPNSITKQTGTADPNITTTLSCNNRGEILSATDTLGQKRKYSYDAFSRPTGVEIYDATGALIDWHFNYYNYNGEIEWEQGARFNPIDYTYYDYDRAGHLLHKASWLSAASANGDGVSGADLAATSYSYDAQGNCTSMTDPNGNKTTMGYDNLGEITSRILPGGANESFSYESGGKIVTHTTVLGATEHVTYTDQGLLQSVSRDDGTTTSYHYDLAGRLVEKISSTSPSYKITYDGNTITRTFTHSGTSLGSISETYDGRGNLLEKTDLIGNTWSYSYDGLNRITTEQGPAVSGNSVQQTITHSYHPNLESIVNGNGECINKFVDALGRPILTTVFNKDKSIAENISNWYSGDHQNVLTTVGTGADAITTSTWSDSRGNPLIIKHADGSSQKFSYDANGNMTSFTDEEGATIRYTYDALNHLTSETLPGGAVIKYSCDPAGNLLTRSMPEGLTAQNSYDSQGHKTSSSLVDSDGATTRNYTYDYTAGVFSSITDPRGFTTSISYDGWQRPINISSSGSSIPQQNQTTTYTYDPRGLITSVAQSSTSGSTLVSRAYDAYGQLTSEATSLNGSPLSSWTQTWDGAGRRTALNWSPGNTSPGAQYAFSYNALGEVTSSQNGSGTNSYVYGDNRLLSQKSTPSGTTTFTRDKNGNIITATLPEISTESLTYRADGKVSSYAISGSAGNETRNYKYDVSGRIVQEPYLLAQSTNNLSAGTQTASYTFDDLNIRLKQEVTADVANVASEKDSFAQVTLDRLNHDASTPTSWTSGYDAQGNLTTHNADSNNQSLTWDSFGHLVNVAQTNNNTTLNWSTVYDGLGRRIQTTSQGNTINYYYDPEVEFLELGHSVNGNRQWNLYGPDRSGVYGGAQGIGGLETCYTENTKSSFGIVNNYFGDVVGLMSGGSFTPYQSALGAYGPMPGSSVNKALQPQWRGHYLDPTGFVSMGARYYDPQAGRFISPDPLGHGSSLSLYDYCNGDPVNGLDPDGRCVEGTAKGYTLGSFAQYDNTAQAIGGFVGTLGSYATPGLGEVAFARDVAGSAWHGLQALGDMYNSGLNWRNGTTLGFSIFGVGAGAFAALAPARAAVEASTSIEESALSSFPAGYQGGPGAMWSGEKLENIEKTSLSVITPHGIAHQSLAPEALELRQRVLAGQSLFRGGNFPLSGTTEAQYWSTQNPLTPGYANSIGAANLNSAAPQFIIGGSIRKGANFITRPAPPYGANTGEALEVVTEPNSIQTDFFYMP